MNSGGSPGKMSRSAVSTYASNATDPTPSATRDRVRRRPGRSGAATGTRGGALALCRFDLVRATRWTITRTEDDEHDRDRERGQEPQVRRNPPVRRDRHERWEPAQGIETERGIEHVLHALLECVVQCTVGHRGEDDAGHRAETDRRARERARDGPADRREAPADERRDKGQHVDEVAVGRRVAALPG